MDRHFVYMCVCMWAVVPGCIEPRCVRTKLSCRAALLYTGTNSWLPLRLAEGHWAESYCMVRLLTCLHYVTMLFAIQWNLVLCTVQLEEMTAYLIYVLETNRGLTHMRSKLKFSCFWDVLNWKKSVLLVLFLHYCMISEHMNRCQIYQQCCYNRFLCS